MQNNERWSVHNANMARRGKATHKWTDEEIGRLENMWWNNPADDAVRAAFPDRSLKACCAKARQLDLPQRTVNMRPGPADTIWVPDAVEILQERWGAGSSARQIALEISERFGCEVSRSAVIGKAARLKLAVHQNAQSGEQIKQMKLHGFVAAPQKIPDFPPRSQCVYPIGNPGQEDFVWCEASVVAGKPYCEDHAALCYRTEKDA